MSRAALAVLGGALFVLSGLGVIYYVFLNPGMVPYYGGGEKLYPEEGGASLALEPPRGFWPGSRRTVKWRSTWTADRWDPEGG